MSIKALIVDDSMTIRKVISRILENFNMAISEAEHGQAALDHCKREMPDFILLDWNMPVMSGIEFLKTLRTMPGGQEPKVILCTTENDIAHIMQAMNEGANEYIMKPFSEDIIRDKLEILGIL